MLKVWRKDADYVQAIPIYLPGDGAVSEYISRSVSEIDELTGPYIHVIAVESILKGNVKAIVGALDQENPRFPGLGVDKLPCLWIEDNTGRTSLVKLPNELEKTKIALRTMAAVSRKTKDADEIGRAVKESVMTKKDERRWAFVSGISLLLLIFFAALVKPEPSEFQYFVFLVILSLAGAGFATFLTGFLEVEIPNRVKAGGAFAAFVIILLIAPTVL